MSDKRKSIPKNKLEAQSFEGAMKEIDDRVAGFRARQEASAPYNYPFTLPKWLELHLWTDEEGLCLICDIEPDHVDIQWGDSPEISNAGFLSNLDIADYPTLDMYSYDERKKLDHDFVETLQYKAYLIGRAENTLKRASKLLRRNTSWPDRPTSPKQWLEFAQSYNIEVPWLEWAESEGLMARSPINANKKPDKRAVDSRLAFIGALLAELDIDPAKANLKKLVGITVDFGAPLTRNTIDAMLRAIPRAVDEVQSRKRVNK